MNELKPVSVAARKALWLVIAVTLALLSGCATGPNANPRDPMEPMNREVAKFNDDLDSVVLKPVATAYKKVTPSLVRTGVSNFFNNISDVGSLINNAMQLKAEATGEMVIRVSFNTVLGFGGLFNLAGELGVDRHPEDFGQTLGYWGIPSGPYLVLPLLGPSTVRDASAMGVDYKYDVTNYRDPIETRTALGVLRIVNARSNLLSLGTMLDEAALDKYSFTRDAYLQRRRSLILDDEDPGGGKDAPPQ
jgi:phospholipid-binding lipoprotein MlaA